MITLENVTKFYVKHGKKKYIVKNSSLVIPDKVNVAILGKKGSGRTTLLKMLAGLDFPVSGKIESPHTFSWIVGNHDGFRKDITVRQNIKFVGRIYGKSEDEIDEIIQDVYTFSEMGEYLDKPMKESPPPMKSQIAFALSLAFDFDYLLIDNMLAVTAGGDAFREKSEEALRKKMEICNVLLVTHSIPDIKKICDVCIVIDNEGLYYFDSIENGITFYRRSIGYSPQLGKKPAKGTIYCEDGQHFKNVNLAANHYKVRPLSILQALNENRGSHVYLKKVFWSEGDTVSTFQNWLYIKEKETILASDGVIFKDASEASHFYAKSNPNIKIAKDHVAMILKDHKGYSKVLNVTFNYLSERE